jgi:hypothetical protein
LLRRGDLEFTAPSLALARAKGRQGSYSYEIEAGSHVSSFATLGPSLELRLMSPGQRLGRVTYRLFGQAGGARAGLDYRGQEGTPESASLLLGGMGSFFVDGGLEGQQTHLLAGSGATYLEQRWEDPDPARRFDELIPKIALGLVTSVPTDAGWVYGLGFRREWLFATDARTGDVYAFSASLVSLVIGW